jgi:hypothetical protein
MSSETRGSGGGLIALVRMAFVLALGGAVAWPFAGQSSSRALGGTDSRSASGGSGSSATVRPSLDAGAPADALRLMAEFAGLDLPESAPAETRFERVHQTFKDRDIAVDFLVATVPDPINSNASWSFDPVVGAIDRAAAASGFLLDRFYIPDWSPEPDGQSDSARPRTRHERWPGVVLFRSAGYTDPFPDKRILVVSLVFETPTAGIHQEAFAEAVRVASKWNPEATVSVLGPTFSGSVTSLSNAVEAFPNLDFRIVTGSATSRRNLSITRTSPHYVTFNSTVHPDDEVIDKLVDFLRCTAGGRERIALLVEGDTSYGSELKAASLRAGGPEPVRQCGAQRPGLESWPADTRILPFPLQISRLRSAATAQGQPASASGNPSRLLGLSLGQSGAPTDQLPSMTPGTTSSAVELELSEILDVITRDHVTTVGLLATDTRDKLFLAQQLARRSAAVRLFTIESDLFYVHPDYSQYVRGMVVASSYPLFVQNQKWVTGTLVNQQFSTTMAEGVYNATVTLLNRDTSGRMLGNRTVKPGLLDYRLPRAERTSGVSNVLQPPIWISVVGNDAIWPVAWYQSKGTDYIQPIEDDSQGGAEPGVLTAYVSAWVVFGVGALGLIACLHVVLYCFPGYLLRGRVRAWPFFRFFSKRGLERRRPYLFAAITVLSVAWGYTVAMMAVTIVYLEPSRLGSAADVIGGSASLLLLVALLACAGHLALHTAWGACRRFAGRGHWKTLFHPQYGLMLTALGCAMLAGLFGGIYLRSVLLNEGRIVYYFERTTHPGNGVSPAMPMILVVSLVYLWAFAHLRRLSAVDGSSIRTSLEPLKVLTGPAIIAPADDLKHFIDGAVQKLPRGLTVLVAFSALIAVFLAVLHPLSSSEPVWFTYAFRAAWILLQILLWLAFAHVAYFWFTLRNAMHAFAGTPMIGAFRRLSPAFFHDRLSPRQPDEADMQRMGHTARQLGLALGALNKVAFAGLTAQLIGVATRKQVVGGGDAPDHEPDAGRHMLWADSAEWTRLSTVVPALANVIAEHWEQNARPTALTTIDIDADGTDSKEFGNDLQRWMMRAEEFVAMHVLLVVRELLSRLANVFFYIIVAVMLMVALQQSFPFQPRQELLGMAWVYVLSAVVLVLTIVVQMEHDDVLSAFASTRSGAMNWDVSLWAKVFMYGVIPIATVFAAQFPGIGSTLLEWLTPVQKALP